MNLCTYRQGPGIGDRGSFRSFHFFFLFFLLGTIQGTGFSSPMAGTLRYLYPGEERNGARGIMTESLDGWMDKVHCVIRKTAQALIARFTNLRTELAGVLVGMRCLPALQVEVAARIIGTGPAPGSVVS